MHLIQKEPVNIVAKLINMALQTQILI